MELALRFRAFDSIKIMMKGVHGVLDGEDPRITNTIELQKKPNLNIEMLFKTESLFSKICTYQTWKLIDLSLIRSSYEAEHDNRAVSWPKSKTVVIQSQACFRLHLLYARCAA